MCAEISACSGTQTKRGPVYIWHADVDEGAKIAVDIATDFIPGITHAKTAYDAYTRIQNGEDSVEVLAAAGTDAALGLIPGLKAAKKIDKALDKAEKVADVADAAGDVAKKIGSLPKPPRGPGSVPKSERDPKRLWTPGEREAKRQARRVRRTPTTPSSRRPQRGGGRGLFIDAADLEGSTPTALHAPGYARSSAKTTAATLG